MSEYTRRHVMSMGAGLGLAGCSLPRSAARKSEILNSATRSQSASDYAIYTVTRAFLPTMANWPMTGSGPSGDWIGQGGGASSDWISQGRGRAAPRIASGDRVDVVIWDNETNSLLATAGQKAVTLNSLLVGLDGGIFVPYLDHVIVSGLTLEEARKKIQQKMSALTPSAQVQMQVQPGQNNSVELVGGVAKPGAYPLTAGGLSLLTLLSLGGGVPSTLNNPVVRLRRHGRNHVTTIARLYATPSFDTYLQGGDKVIIESDPRSFIALGASRIQRMVQFTKDQISALDAMAELGGVNPGRANPQGILILRQYKGSQVSKTGSNGPSAQQAIFVLDLTKADGLFAAGRFLIHPDDLIYVSESKLTAVDTISGIIGTMLGLSQRTQNLAD